MTNVPPRCWGSRSNSNPQLAAGRGERGRWRRRRLVVRRRHCVSGRSGTRCPSTGLRPTRSQPATASATGPAARRESSRRREPRERFDAGNTSSPAHSADPHCAGSGGQATGPCGTLTVATVRLQCGPPSAARVGTVIRRPAARPLGSRARSVAGRAAASAVVRREARSNWISVLSLVSCRPTVQHSPNARAPALAPPRRIVCVTPFVAASMRVTLGSRRIRPPRWSHRLRHGSRVAAEADQLDDGLAKRVHPRDRSPVGVREPGADMPSRAIATGAAQE